MAGVSIAASPVTLPVIAPIALAAAAGVAKAVAEVVAEAATDERALPEGATTTATRNPRVRRMTEGNTKRRWTLSASTGEHLHSPLTGSSSASPGR